MIQTWMPDQPVMKALASGDRDRFLAAEAAARRHSGLPPFGRLAALIVSAADAASPSKSGSSSASAWKCLKPMATLPETSANGFISKPGKTRTLSAFLAVETTKRS